MPVISPAQRLNAPWSSQSVQNSRITILENHHAVDLLTSRKHLQRPNNHCLGAYVLDVHTKDVTTIRAGVTVLATGGAGKVYRYTSNPDVATGDGFGHGLPCRSPRC